MADCRTTATLVVNQLRDSLRTLGVTVTATVPRGDDACPVISVRVNAEGGTFYVCFAETDSSWRLTFVQPRNRLLPLGDRLKLLIAGLRQSGIGALEWLEQISIATGLDQRSIHVEDEELEPMQRPPAHRNTASTRARDRERGLRKAPDIV